MSSNPHNSLLDDYDEFPRIEVAFQEELDKSLGPRGSEMLFDIVRGLGLAPGSTVLDLGCGEGAPAVKLAKDFGFEVVGVDPVPRHMRLSNEEFARAAERDPGLSKRVRFELGSAEAIPLADASVDLIWCREVIVLVEALDEAFAECRRVLRPSGRMLLYQMFATDLLEPGEAERMWGSRVVPAGWDVARVEAAFTGAGLKIDQLIEVAGEWGERNQEDSAAGGRRLVHVARLMRDPDRYIAKFGRRNYDIMLRDCLWHVYRMIGKLSGRVYLLKQRT